MEAAAVAVAMVMPMVPLSMQAVPLEVVVEALAFMAKGVLVVAAALEVEEAAEDLEALTVAPVTEVATVAVAVVQADTIIPTSAVQQQLDLVLQVLFV